VIYAEGTAELIVERAVFPFIVRHYVIDSEDDIAGAAVTIKRVDRTVERKFAPELIIDIDSGVIASVNRGVIPVAQQEEGTVRIECLKKYAEEMFPERIDIVAGYRIGYDIKNILIILYT
jgi:hypothetical protein